MRFFFSSPRVTWKHLSKRAGLLRPGPDPRPAQTLVVEVCRDVEIYCAIGTLFLEGFGRTPWAKAIEDQQVVVLKLYVHIVTLRRVRLERIYPFRPLPPPGVDLGEHARGALKAAGVTALPLSELRVEADETVGSDGANRPPLYRSCDDPKAV